MKEAYETRITQIEAMNQDLMVTTEHANAGHGNRFLRSCQIGLPVGAAAYLRFGQKVTITIEIHEESTREATHSRAD